MSSNEEVTQGELQKREWIRVQKKNIHSLMSEKTALNNELVQAIERLKEQASDKQRYEELLHKQGRQIERMKRNRGLLEEALAQSVSVQSGGGGGIDGIQDINKGMNNNNNNNNRLRVNNLKEDGGPSSSEVRTQAVNDMLAKYGRMENMTLRGRSGLPGSGLPNSSSTVGN